MAVTYERNVIVVDWSTLARTIYIEATMHTRTVGQHLAKFCIFLSLYANIPPSNIHFIGHSLGGQVAAYAGMLVQKELYQKIGRITGLDPAAPLFEYPDPEIADYRLDRGDAAFVDVIHTNGNHLGIIKPAGHVDFYPNGGEIQPDCKFCKY